MQYRAVDRISWISIWVQDFAAEFGSFIRIQSRPRFFDQEIVWEKSHIFSWRPSISALQKQKLTKLINQFGSDPDPDALPRVVRIQSVSGSKTLLQQV